MRYFVRYGAIVLFLLVLTSPASSQLAGNAACPGEDVFYNPDNGQDIIVPNGYKVDVFVKNLNMPTDIAFAGNRVFVLDSGTCLPGRCNNNEQPAFGGKFAATNPFTPDLLVFNMTGHQVAGPLGKPTPSGGGFQPDGPAIRLAFELDLQGGRLFASDSNQGVRGAPGRGNNTSRIVTVDPKTGVVTPFIVGLPTGDHPTEQILVKDGWLYWSQGSATNSGVTGHDNGAGGNQHDIACQQITLSNNAFDSGDGHHTSGYSNHGVARPGAIVPAFEDATKPGMCTGAILRAQINATHPENTIQPFSWGYRNPFGIRFAPTNHALQGKLLVTENGEDEHGTPPEGHDIQLVNSSKPGEPLKLELTRFAFNCPEADQIRIPGRAPQCVSIADQAFVSQIRGINRPVTARFGPDGVLYLVDYGAVRDFGQGDPDSRFTNPADAPLVVIPHTGVIWRISTTRGIDD